MKEHVGRRRVVSSVAALAVCAALALNPIATSSPDRGKRGEPRNAKVERQLVGTWRLLSYLVRSPTGQVLGYPWGEDAVGKLTYTRSGQMWVHFASRVRGPNTLWYTGTFDVDATAGTVTHHVEYASSAGFVSDQVRPYRLAGDQLRLRAPARPGSPVIELNWQRVDRRGGR